MIRTLVLVALCLSAALPAPAADRSEMERLAAEPARRLPKWPYEKLVAASDVVAIVEPLENRRADDAFEGSAHGHAPADFAATDTRFRVHAVLKGEAPREVTVLHFAYAPGVRRQRDASFIRFVTGPLQFEKRVVSPGRTPMSDVTLGPPRTFLGLRPTWLAFLARREDGRYAPVTGQYDAVFSFRELHDASFYAAP